jgi:hypothetical protein
MRSDRMGGLRKMQANSKLPANLGRFQLKLRCKLVGMKHGLLPGEESGSANVGLTRGIFRPTLMAATAPGPTDPHKHYTRAEVGAEAVRENENKRGQAV